MRTVTIVGVGRVGGALALALSKANYRIEHLVSRHPTATERFAASLPGRPLVTDLSGLKRTTSEILLITTQDAQIKATAEALAPLPSVKGGFAFHASGALSRNELDSLERAGRHTGSLHPLISISESVRGADSLRGAFFAVEGQSEALKEATAIVIALGGNPFEIDTDSKTLYHAAAVVACGHLVALIETSQRMLSLCGLDEETAKKVLHPLIESTVANLGANSAGEALTGPFARADVETVERHVQELAVIADEDIDGVYRLLGRISLDISGRRGADPDRIAKIRNIILLDKSNTRC